MAPGTKALWIPPRHARFLWPEEEIRATVLEVADSRGRLVTKTCDDPAESFWTDAQNARRDPEFA
jgi:hypothetical protein